ncbi:hypothetical protein ONA70_02435 [Micromonospora yasonensis]|uniref:hypothetical protein n=1 Tax=Micromonospora yasonensis TaxID=1128667 RepID=UPI002231756C|nr:hypothetical protein [Micromonospora yasonensis]MCW3838953.1 hypothetical protein [Micromonospora yasonensis]
MRNLPLTVEIDLWKGGPVGPPRTGGPTSAPATAAFDQQYDSRAHMAAEQHELHSGRTGSEALDASNCNIAKAISEQ